MKSILCYGDSLTWGFEAGTMKRHAFADRWPNVLAAGLEGKARTIAEGLNGRTTIYDDFAVQEDRNGARTLPIMLSTHQPLDLVIIMLGSNDLKFGGRCRAVDAKWGMERLVEIVKQFALWAGQFAAADSDHGAAGIVPDQGRGFRSRLRSCDRGIEELRPALRETGQRYRVPFLRCGARGARPIRSTASISMQAIRARSARHWSSRSERFSSCERCSAIAIRLARPMPPILRRWSTWRRVGFSIGIWSTLCASRRIPPSRRGERRIRNNAESLVHWSQWIVAEADGDAAGGYTGHFLAAAHTDDSKFRSLCADAGTGGAGRRLVVSDGACRLRRAPEERRGLTHARRCGEASDQGRRYADEPSGRERERRSGAFLPKGRISGIGTARLYTLPGIAR